MFNDDVIMLKKFHQCSVSEKVARLPYKLVKVTKNAKDSAIPNVTNVMNIIVNVTFKPSVNVAAKAHKATKTRRLLGSLPEMSEPGVEAETLHFGYPKKAIILIVNNLSASRSTTWLLQCGDIEANPGPALDQEEVRHQGQPQRPQLLLQPQHQVRQANDAGERPAKSQLQVLSQNVRGLGDSKKVRHLVNSCYKLAKNSADSFFLFQETYVSRLDILKYLWRGEHHLTMGSGNSLGCISLITAPYKIIKAVDFGQRGHALVLTKTDINRAELIIVNIYAPNGYDVEKVRFFEEVVEKVTELKDSYECNKVVLAGDLNLVFRSDEVKNRQYTQAEQRIASSVKLALQRIDLVDGWDVAEKDASHGPRVELDSKLTQPLIE